MGSSSIVEKVTGEKLVGRHTDCQEISRSCNRGESEKSLVCRLQNMQVEGSTLILKPGVDVTRSSEQWYQHLLMSFKFLFEIFIVKNTKNKGVTLNREWTFKEVTVKQRLKARLRVPSTPPFLWAARLILLAVCVNSTTGLHWTHFWMVRKKVILTVRVNQTVSINAFCLCLCRI